MFSTRRQAHTHPLVSLSHINKVIQMGLIINQPWNTYPLTPGYYCLGEPMCVVQY